MSNDDRPEDDDKALFKLLQASDEYLMHSWPARSMRKPFPPQLQRAVDIALGNATPFDALANAYTIAHKTYSRSRGAYPAMRRIYNPHGPILTMI